MGKQGWGRRGKTKKQQPNLARAAAAIGRLVSGHDGEESGSSGGAGGKRVWEGCELHTRASGPDYMLVYVQPARPVCPLTPGRRPAVRQAP